MRKCYHLGLGRHGKGYQVHLSTMPLGVYRGAWGPPSQCQTAKSEPRAGVETKSQKPEVGREWLLASAYPPSVSSGLRAEPNRKPTGKSVWEMKFLKYTTVNRRQGTGVEDLQMTSILAERNVKSNHMGKF